MKVTVTREFQQAVRRERYRLVETDNVETKGIYINHCDIDDTDEKTRMGNKRSFVFDIKDFLVHS